MVARIFVPIALYVSRGLAVRKLHGFPSARARAGGEGEEEDLRGSVSTRRSLHWMGTEHGAPAALSVKTRQS